MDELRRLKRPDSELMRLKRSPGMRCKLGLRPAMELKPQELRDDPRGRAVSLPSASVRTLEELGIEHRFIRSGRPQTNGCFERLQGTILEECWKPSFAHYPVPATLGYGRISSTI